MIHLPENTRRLACNETFSFSCHPGISCFTECCRELELALSPYDVLRLARELELSTGDFLDQYAIVEHPEGEAFPRVYLGMVDDGRASCPFVSEKGCRVYQGRPGACRTYPVGRAAILGCNNRVQEFFVLVSEPHCLGFSEPVERTVSQWTDDQGVGEYNAVNDELLSLLHHPKIKQGMTLDAQQRDRFLLALYNLDDFKRMMAESEANGAAVDREGLRDLPDDAVSWFRMGIRLLRQEFFDE